MNAQQLKNSILEYALQGKLVPQDPKDEPAERVMQKIYEEKKYLIREKIIKSNKELPPITEDEIPYDIPESWKWVRLNDLAESCNVPFADGPFGSNLKKEHYISDPEVRIIQLSNIGEDGWQDNNVKYTSFQYLEKIKRSQVDPGDIVIAKMMPAGRSILVPNIDQMYVLSSDAVKFVPSKILDKTFLLYAINSNVFRRQIYSEVQGITRVRTSLTKIKKYVLPIPPISEQHRIVSKINEIFEKIKIFSTNQKEILELQNSFPNKLENSILHYAMQGKLVEQDQDDESAVVLVEQIRKEKEQLIHEKVIKKEKPIPPINKEEIPFDIPSSWEWVRIGSIINLISGRDLTPSEYGTNNKETPYITGASNFNKGIVEVTRWTHCPKVISKKGDILITCKGTVGELAIQNIDEAHIARQVMAIRLIHTLNKEYILLCLKYKVTELKHAAKSMIPGISREDLLNLIIPIPPLEEQKRIVKAIAELQTIKNKLTTL